MMKSKPNARKLNLQFFSSLSLKSKILILFTGSTILILIAALIFISNQLKRQSVENAIAQIGITADQQALMIQNALEKNLYIARTLSGTAKSCSQLPPDRLNSYLTSAYRDVLQSEPNILSVWDSWELKFLDPAFSNSYGRIRNMAWRSNGTILTKSETILTPDSPQYARIKKELTESVEEPYFFSFDNGSPVLMTSLVVPNIIDGKFAGVSGVDIPLTGFNELIRGIDRYEGSYAFVLSTTLKFIAHPDKNLAGDDAMANYEELFTLHGVPEIIANGNSAFFEGADASGANSFVAIRPIIIGSCPQSWALVLLVPKGVVLHDATVIFWKTLLVGLAGILLLTLLIQAVARKYILEPIIHVSENLSRLAKGHVDGSMKVHVEVSDELGAMSEYLNRTVDGLTKKTEFAQTIGQGNYGAKMELMSDEDALGQSLIDLSANLKKAQEEVQKRAADDQKRQWTNEGLAKFSEILRQNNDRLDLLSINILRNLIDYLGANQGGLFVYNDDDPSNPFFDLLAAYAYNRQKFIKKRILPGEGLIGTCAIEKQTIYLTEIPENYITISSGLGEAKPRNLLIVPMKVDENVLGVIEIASFSAIMDYQVEFVEKLAQSIAQTLTTVKTNLKTAELLEKTQQQTEEMKAQEEEVRQNLEELATIKEELEKRNEDILENQKQLEWEKSLLDSLLNYVPDKIYFKDLKSRFIKVSRSTLKAHGFENPDDLIGKTDFDLFGEEHARPAYEDEQNIIRTDSPIIGLVEKEVFTDGRVSWAETSKLPLKNPRGETIGTFGITRDITASKLMEEEVKKKEMDALAYQRDMQKKALEAQNLYEAINNSTYVIEYNPDGYITFINDAYLELLNSKREDVVGKHHSYQLDFTDEQRKNYKQFWDDLNSGIARKETHRFTVGKRTYLFFETYTPLKDENGKVFKIMKIAVNVSHLLHEGE